MKKMGKKWLVLALCVMGILAMVTGCSSSKLADCFDEDSLKKQAIADIELAASENYQGWVERFQEGIQGSLTEATYDSYLSALKEKGAFKEYGKTAFVGQEKDGKNYAGVVMIVEYDNGKIQYSLGYDEDMKLIQFLIK